MSVSGHFRQKSSVPGIRESSMPPLPQVGAGGLWGVFLYTGVEKGCLVSQQPACPVPGPAAAPLWARSPPSPRPRHGGPASPPCLAALLTPLDVLSEPSTFLQGFTRDRHTRSRVGATASCPRREGDTHVLCF